MSLPYALLTVVAIEIILDGRGAAVIAERKVAVAHTCVFVNWHAINKKMKSKYNLTSNNIYMCQNSYHHTHKSTGKALSITLSNYLPCYLPTYIPTYLPIYQLATE